ncbi:ATP-binding cassette, subfamily C [Actinacidiphila alni]|uniref:ATP-binding cassette, subfamily C n=1 Tax=Actinacidiphila alni TaxID=380248 RepID=A0A1I2BDC0_9ACTN|nr:ABC transporter ATP-binding protein [Actinacidiphila alni]SFE53303.1 ATP-binding cassette, subfamily C [Actinacidiphila alni]
MSARTATAADRQDTAADLLPTATPRRTARAVVELVGPHRRLALVTVAVFVAESLVGLVGPLALGRIVDAVQQHRGDHPVVVASGVLLAAVLAQAVLTALGLRLTARVGETALARLRERVIASAFALPAQRVEQVGAGDLAARIGDDATLVAGALRNVLPNVAGAALTIGFTVLGLTALDWRFALAGLCALPIQIVTLRWYLRTSGPLYAAQRIAGGERTRQILESLSGVDTVRAFRLTERQTARVADRSAAAMDYALRAVTLRSRFFGRLNSAEFTGLGLILCVGYWLVHSGHAGVGEATAAALLFVRLFDPVNILLGLAATAQEAAAGLARLVGAADLGAADATATAPAPARPGCAAPDPADPDPANSATVDPDTVQAPAGVARGSVSGPDGLARLTAVPAPRAAEAECPVEAVDVRHAYVEGRPVLHGVTLRLAPGEQVTLVGTTGAGKSTLARIVAGVHPPTAGRVTVGARGRAGRPAVLLLDQDTHVFAGTVADNLLLARPDADEAALEAALDMAGALAWVRALPQELATRIGAGGAALTPVQAQQLALARLALADPPVAVLDESAAEAGSEGARTLEAAARTVLAGRTALVVAHRLGQAAAADRVVVLEDGRIVEEGPHDDLVAAGGHYAELWSAWSARAAVPPGA